MKILEMWDLKITQLNDGSFCARGIMRSDLTKKMYFGYGITEKQAIKSCKGLGNKVKMNTNQSISKEVKN